MDVPLSNEDIAAPEEGRPDATPMPGMGLEPIGGPLEHSVRFVMRVARPAPDGSLDVQGLDVLLTFPEEFRDSYSRLVDWDVNNRMREAMGLPEESPTPPIVVDSLTRLAMKLHEARHEVFGELGKHLLAITLEEHAIVAYPHESTPLGACPK